MGLSDTYRTEIVRRAVDRREQLCDVVVESILAELPEYANGRSPGDLADIRAGVQSSIDLCLATLAGRADLSEDERHVLRATGAQRARQGVPQAALLASVKIAVRVGRTFLMTCTDVGDDASALMAAFRTLTEGLDRFEDAACSALAEGHEEAWGHVLSAVDRGEAVLVDRLLEHRFEDAEEVLAHAAGMGLSRSRIAYPMAVVPAGPSDEAALRAAADDVRSLVLAAVGPVRPAPRLHLPLVVQPRDGDEWRHVIERLPAVATRHRVTIVWGERGESLSELVSPYRSLRDGLPFLAAATTRATALPAVITRFHRIVCTGSPGERRELLAAILGPLFALPEREQAELLEVVDALYETGGSPSALARHLHLHKNTVANRLRRVQEVVGLDVRRPAERLVLELALRIRHVDPAAEAVPAPPAVLVAPIGT